MPRVGIGLAQFTPVGDGDRCATAFAAAAAELHRRAEGLRRTRLFRLAGEQLLPARSLDPGHSHVALYETDDMTELAGLATTGAVPGFRIDGPVAASGVRASWLDLLLDTTEPSAVAPGRQPPRFTGPITGGPGLFCSFTEPASTADDAAYNRWWNEIHLRDTLLLAGMDRGRRYRRAADLQPAVDPVPRDYLALYDVDAVGRVPWQRATLAGIAEISAQPMSDALDRTSVRGFTYEQLSDRTGRGEEE